MVRLEKKLREKKVVSIFFLSLEKFWAWRSNEKDITLSVSVWRRLQSVYWGLCEGGREGERYIYTEKEKKIEEEAVVERGRKRE